LISFYSGCARLYGPSVWVDWRLLTISAIRSDEEVWLETLDLGFISLWRSDLISYKPIHRWCELSPARGPAWRKWWKICYCCSLHLWFVESPRVGQSLCIQVNLRIVMISWTNSNGQGVSNQVKSPTRSIDLKDFWDFSRFQIFLKIYIYVSRHTTFLINLKIIQGVSNQAKSPTNSNFFKILKI